jgi:hypothetical protein
LVWNCLLAAMSASVCSAETPPGPDAETDINSEQLIKKLIEMGKKNKGGSIQVPKERAALCPVCHQPFYKHLDPNYECVPPDERTGRPRRPQQIKTAPVTCPVCQSHFDGPLQGNLNNRNGLDRDFCRHSAGQAVVHASVWMCPDCGYAGLASEQAFGREINGAPLSEASVQFVKTKLTAATRERVLGLLAGVKVTDRLAPFIEQNWIPDWMKYENALALLGDSKVKPPHTLLGKLYVEAAHSCRRFACSELGIVIADSQFQVMLGQSIRRVNNWLAAECLAIQGERRQEILDPTQPETDPEVLELAATRLRAKFSEIIRNESLNAARSENQAAQPTRVNMFDEFVLHIRHGGFLDRLGRGSDALKQFAAAQDVIPKSFPPGPEALQPELKEHLDKQLATLRDAAAARAERVRQERDYLYRAADQLMQALYFNESPDKLEPAANAYLIGEMLRRGGGEPEAALAWFRAAWLLLPRLDPAKAKPVIPPGTTAQEAERIRERAAASVEAQRELLTAWTGEQARLVKELAGQKVPRENVLPAIAKVLERAGAPPLSSAPALPGADAAVPPKSASLAGDEPPARRPAPAPVPAKTADEPAGKTSVAAKTEPAAPAAPGQTREALLARYYQALQKHNQDKKANPPSLAELVKGGYLSAQGSCLDAQGKLVCPVSGKPLLYMPMTALGEHQPIIFPAKGDPLRVCLFGDGQVGEQKAP